MQFFSDTNEEKLSYLSLKNSKENLFFKFHCKFVDKRTSVDKMVDVWN